MFPSVPAIADIFQLFAIVHFHTAAVHGDIPVF